MAAGMMALSSMVAQKGAPGVGPESPMMPPATAAGVQGNDCLSELLHAGAEALLKPGERRVAGNSSVKLQRMLGMDGLSRGMRAKLQATGGRVSFRDKITAVIGKWRLSSRAKQVG